jgi:hypothetical protein
MMVNRYHKLSAFVILQTLLIVCLSGQSVLAQQTVKEAYQQRQEQLQQKFKQSGQQHGKLMFNSGGIDVAYDQRWINSEQPDPKYNINLAMPGIYAGDVNGDGKDDYVRVDNARDDRSSKLEDRTWKTGLFYSGANSTKPDQLLYAKIEPVGDINNDGYADAVVIENSTLQILPGSSSGYDEQNLVDLGISMSSWYLVQGFMDLNGDDNADLAVYSGSGNTFHYVMGNSSFSNLSPVAHVSPLEIGNDGGVMMFDDTNQNLHMIRVNHPVTIAQWENISTDGDTTNDQSIEKEISTDNDYINQAEILAYTNNGSQISVLEQSSNTNRGYIVELSMDGTTASRSVAPGNNFGPAGDVNQDGTPDYFYLNDSGVAYLSYGDGDITNALTEDVKIADVSGDNDAIYWIYQDFHIQPDYNGDGNGDLWTSNLIDGNGNRERRLYNLDGSGNLNLAASISYASSIYNNTVVFTDNVGDVNGDGIDDIAFMYGAREMVEIYYGGSSISGSADETLNLNIYPLQSSTGDVNGDGNTDLVINDNSGRSVEIFLGSGSGFSNTADITLHQEDTNTNISDPGLYFGSVIGDVNDDGIDDIGGLSVFGGDETSSGFEYANEGYIYYGGSTISDSPDKSFEISSSTNNISTYGIKGKTDLNDDGVDDFVIKSWGADGNDLSSYPGDGYGAAFVYYGGSNKSYSSPDLTITPPDDGNTYYNFADQMVLTDVNNDGVSDLLLSTYYLFQVESNYYSSAVTVYHGGSSMDGQIDQRAAASSNLVIDNFRAIHDLNGDGVNELLFNLDSNWSFVTSFSEGTIGNDAMLVMDNPNSSVSLGGYWDYATLGKFTGDGTYSIIASQSGDDNDQYYSSRVYRFDVPKAIQLTEVADVSDDQGGWVTVSTDGIAMKGQANSFQAFDEWSVWRETSSGWTNVANVPYYEDAATFVDVRVPTTRSSDAASDSDEGKYKFRVTLHQNGETVAESNTMTGYALDNVSPAKVTGVSQTDTQDGVRLSWDASPAEDVNEYAVYLLNGDGSISDNPVKTVSDTKVAFNATSSDRDFVVKAVDVHGNEGKASDPVTVTNIEDGKSGTPEHFALEKNYPNPFNPTTKIDYALPHSAKVTITVYNTLGQAVATLVNGRKSAGYHSVKFDAESMNSGVYLYRIQAGDYTKIQKMMLVK